jgi:hypothetical protein
MSLIHAKAQMAMNVKRPAEKIRAMLHRVSCTLKHNYSADPAEYYIKEAWVGKGHYTKAIKIHGRGRFGVMHHPRSHVKIILGKRNPNPTREEKEFDKLVHLFRSRPLVDPLRQSTPIQFSNPVWSKKPWKYLTSPKWMSPNNALKREAKLEK